MKQIFNLHVLYKKVLEKDGKKGLCPYGLAKPFDKLVCGINLFCTNLWLVGASKIVRLKQNLYTSTTAQAPEALKLIYYLASGG